MSTNLKNQALPLNLKIQESHTISLGAANSFLDKFLHDGVAIHAANNTVASQLHQLHQGLKEEKKRLRGSNGHADSTEF